MIYIAAPFFNDYQIGVVDKIIEVLEKEGIEYFSPKDEFPILEGRLSSPEERERVFWGNIQGIRDSNLMISVIDDFDRGVIWEMGYAFHMGVPILGYTDIEGRGMNIMLEMSCMGFVVGTEELEEFLRNEWQ